MCAYCDRLLALYKKDILANGCLWQNLDLAAKDDDALEIARICRVLDASSKTMHIRRNRIIASAASHGRKGGLSKLA